VSEAAANRVWETPDDPGAAATERCRVVQGTMRDCVHGLTCYHWWPAFA